jgi:hypothetical protein
MYGGVLMTEKELLYIEDAVNHEIYTIRVLKEAICSLESDNLIKVVNKLIKYHTKQLDMLMDIF